MLELIERVGLVEASEIHDHLTLPYELRQRGRLRARTDTGYDVGLFLDRGPVLQDGACLAARTGEIIRIRAADEPVVTAYIEMGLPMARLCYHLGNRHVSLGLGEELTAKDGPVDSKTGWVRFPPDHVLEELAERLGATLIHHQAPFDPESGAYAQAGQGHSHGHSDGHGHSHSHSESHSHSHSHAHRKGHGHAS